ncbi:hypothetical protein [Halobacteriovorax sp. ZH4_bin.1]|uniref:hypothetical protein n=1 Tax=unclassified Halobacteriovorax TaxID=2639665 RepID=UPI0037190113
MINQTHSLQSAGEFNPPHDILLFSKELKKDWRNISTFLLETYSVDSKEQTLCYLLDFLPVGPKKCDVQLSKISNLNLSSKFEDLLNSKNQGLILPFLQLEKCIQEVSGRIHEQLEKMDFIILPLSVFTKSTNSHLREVRGETIKISSIIKGNEIVNIQKILRKGPLPSRPNTCFIGFPETKRIKNLNNCIYDKLISKQETVATLPSHPSFLFVTSHYNFSTVKNNTNNEHILFCGGSTTWKKGLAQGLWFHGSSDGFGHGEINVLKNSKAIKIMAGTRPWKVLSREGATSIVGDVIGTYHYVINKTNNSYLEQLKNIDVFFWTSSHQAKTFMENFPEVKWNNKIHACGLGKTFDGLEALSLNPIPFISLDHFISWIKDGRDESRDNRISK